MKTLYRGSTFFLAVILVFSIFSTGALAAKNSLENFEETRSYASGQFSDLTGHWSADYVVKAYCVGMIDGFEDSTFRPEGTLSIAGAIKLAACLNSIYATGELNFKNGDPWYQEYLDYCVSNKITTDSYGDYNKDITRAQFAQIFANCLPSDALPSINTIEDNAVLDVPSSASYASAVYTLYRAGILTGDAGTNAYRPNDSIKRGEVSTLLTRMMDASTRQSLTLTVPAVLTAEQIYALCAPSVFYIEVYNAQGTAIGFGSGVFISADGMAVTNYHVIEGAYSAKVTATNGKTYDVAGVYGYSEANDIARIKVNGSGFTPMTIGDSHNVKTGASIFAIGNPKGLESTISTGIISTASRTVEGTTYIQISAPISSGSSGGALIDAQGRLIGITTATIVDSQNLNLAVPIHQLESLGSSSVTPLSTLFPGSSPGNITYYAAYPTVPDFGAYIGASLYYSESASTSDASGMAYYYKASGIPGGIDAADDLYYKLLQNCGFTYQDSQYIEGLLFDVYMNGDFSIVIGTTKQFYDNSYSQYYVVMVVK